MEHVADLLKAVLFGIVEGVTEWVPVSSTGHMILLNEFIRMDVTPEFWSVFLVVIQLGAVLAAVITFFDRLWPLDLSRSARLRGHILKRDILRLWWLIIIACVPAVIVGLLFDDIFDALFYNGISVSIALIVFGVGFIIVENRNRGRAPYVDSMEGLTVRNALLIGLFQVLAAVFPGTSRSGATILGGLILGISRSVAAEFTFLLAVPVMLGASLLKLVKYGLHFSSTELIILLVGMAVAFVVSLFVIRFFMSYIRRHDFKVFGWYRIVLGAIVLSYFLVREGMQYGV